MKKLIASSLVFLGVQVFANSSGKLLIVCPNPSGQMDIHTADSVTIKQNQMALKGTTSSRRNSKKPAVISAEGCIIEVEKTNGTLLGPVN